MKQPLEAIVRTYIHAYHIHLISGHACPSNGPNHLCMGERLIEEQLPALVLVRRTARTQSVYFSPWTQSADYILNHIQNHILVQPWPKGTIL